MTRNVRLGELLLGIEGLAILRQLLRGDDSAVRARVDELVDMCGRIDQDPLSLTISVPELEPVEGYTSWAGTYDGGGNPLIDLEEPVIQKILSELPAGRAVDVCCGTGRHTGFLLDQGHDAIGIDATHAMLQKARENVGRGVFSIGDACRLPMEDESVDLVVCALALTHFEDITPPIAEFGRTLHPGGHAVLSDLHPLIRAIGGGAFFAAADGTFGLVREHLHLHSSYLEAFRAAGLSVVECRELPLGERQIEMFGFAFQNIPEAQRQSHGGLPFALIWHLVKR